MSSDTVPGRDRHKQQAPAQGRGDNRYDFFPHYSLLTSLSSPLIAHGSTLDHRGPASLRTRTASSASASSTVAL